MLKLFLLWPFGKTWKVVATPVGSTGIQRPFNKSRSLGRFTRMSIAFRQCEEQLLGMECGGSVVGPLK